MQWLKDADVVSQTDLGQRGIGYQIIGPHPHHHLVCLTCGHVIDADDSVIDTLRALAAGVQLRATHRSHGVFGTCRNCQHQGNDG